MSLPISPLTEFQPPCTCLCTFVARRGLDKHCNGMLTDAHREEEATEVHGHITSLAVARTHRKLGIATRLMQASREQQSKSLDHFVSHGSARS